jgi:hypothetical protein
MAQDMLPMDIGSFVFLCKALVMLMDCPTALFVLDPASGKFLKHCHYGGISTTRQRGIPCMPMS